MLRMGIPRHNTISTMIILRLFKRESSENKRRVVFQITYFCSSDVDGGMRNNAV